MDKQVKDAGLDTETVVELGSVTEETAGSNGHFEYMIDPHSGILPP